MFSIREKAISKSFLLSKLHKIMHYPYPPSCQLLLDQNLNIRAINGKENDCIRKQEWLEKPLFDMLEVESSGQHIRQQIEHEGISSFQAMHFNVPENLYHKYIATVLGAPHENENHWKCYLFPSISEDYEAKYHQKKIELQNFIYRTSHNLLGPVKTLMGLIELLKNENEENNIKLFISMIDDTAHKLNQLISRLIEYTELTSSALNKPDQIDFEKIIYQVLQSLSKEIDITNIFFKINNQVGRTFYCHEHLLIVTFKNIIANALRAHEYSEAGEVIINIREVEDEGVLISIKNNGNDIPQYLENKLFDMFSKGPGNENFQGLGLYIVKNIIEMLDGNITFNRDESGYISFEILLKDMNPYFTAEQN